MTMLQDLETIAQITGEEVSLEVHPSGTWFVTCGPIKIRVTEIGRAPRELRKALVKETSRNKPKYDKNGAKENKVIQNLVNHIN